MNPRSAAWALLLTLGFPAAGAANAAPGDSVWVIRGVNVLPMTSLTPVLLANHAVVVRDGTIVRVAPDAEVANPPGARVIDGRGRYLMPGLIDMHAHVAASYLPLFLANGVTTVRDMNGSRARLALRERVRSGELPGPRLFVATPLLTGQPWPVGHAIVPDPDSARALVRAAAIAGYDLIKIYDGLSAATYAALVASAREHGLPVTGHIPASVGLDGVLAAGQHIEHVEKIVWATVGHEPDTVHIPGIVQRIRDARVAITPTLYAQKVLTMQGTAWFDALFERPENAHVEAETLAWWRSLRRSAVSSAEDPTRMGTRLHTFQRALVLQLFRAGVPVLFGTDTPNPLVVPGFSAHDEIAVLTEAAIPIYDVLRSATAVAGAHLGVARLGTIAEGAPADLLLLRDHPLLAPQTLRRPDAVIVAGAVYHRDRLDRLIATGSPRVSVESAAHRDAAARGRELHGVRQKIQYDLVVALFIGQVQRSRPRCGRRAPTFSVSSLSASARAPSSCSRRSLCDAET